MTTIAASTLTTADLHHAVRDLAPRIAVFDCDGTLWSGDAGSGFMHYTIATGLLSRDAIDWLNERYRLYLAGQVSELAICGEMVQVYQGLRVSELRAAAATFFQQKIAANLFPELEALVAGLHAAGTQIWAVSSTNNWVIEAGIVQRFGIPPHRILCARVAVDDGIATSRLLDVPTDQGKVDSLAHAGITAPDAVFGNSIHDAAMLAIARRAFPVNPTPALLRQATVEGWPVYYPASVKPV